MFQFSFVIRVRSFRSASSSPAPPSSSDAPGRVNHEGLVNTISRLTPAPSADVGTASSDPSSAGRECDSFPAGQDRVVLGWRMQCKGYWIGPDVGLVVVGPGMMINLGSVVSCVVDAFPLYSVIVSVFTVLSGLRGKPRTSLSVSLYLRFFSHISDTAGSTGRRDHWHQKDGARAYGRGSESPANAQSEEFQPFVT
jgi:hypothetical protein